MKTNKDYTFKYRDYGTITIPKGTRLTHRTALGIDKNYHFVDEYQWIHDNYSSFAALLKHDVMHYGINVPKEFVDYENNLQPITK